MAWTEEDKKQAMKDWYEENKDEHKNKVRKRKQKLLSWYKGLKDDWECVECGDERKPVLQFHHTKENEYDKSPRKMAGEGYGKETIKSELSKGDVLCANCHRIKHAEDHGFTGD